MRKLVLPVTLFVLAALLLSACSAATPAAPTSAPTTAVMDTVAPSETAASTATVEATAGATAAATAAATTEGTAAATTEATTAATASATTAATAAATTEGTASAGTTTPEATTAAGAATATPAATTADGTATATPAATTAAGTTDGTASTTNGQYVRLNALLNAKINAKDNSQVGKVAGFVFQHPPIPVVSAATPDPKATPTVAPTMSAEQNKISIRYVLVSLTSSTGGVVAVPWQAFTYSGGLTGASASTDANGNTATLSIDPTAFGSAPHTSLTDISGGSTAWVGTATTFWSGQGVTMSPSGTEADAAANLFMLPGSRGVGLISMSDMKDNAFGTTSDMFVDAKTGEVAYVVFNGGSTFGNKTFIVPVNMLDWTALGKAANINNRGGFSVQIPDELMKTAPFFNSITAPKLDQTTLDTLMKFWSTIQSLTK